MSDTVTPRLGLPLMQAAQAQKHVTLNESLIRLDGLSNLVVQQLHRTTPPDPAPEGMAYGVGAGAVNGWSGRDGQIAIGAGGGWVFVSPFAGMRAHVADTGIGAIHDGREWVEGALTLGRTGAGMIAGLAEANVALSAGASVTTSVLIPSGAMVVGVTARVGTAVTGSLTTWKLGTTGALDRFGKGLGKAAGSWVRGILGAPMTYWDAAPLIVTAEGGTIAGGSLRLAVHWWELRVPD